MIKTRRMLGSGLSDKAHQNSSPVEETPQEHPADKQSSDDPVQSADQPKGPNTCVFLADSIFELSISDASQDLTDIIADSDFHALIIKDESACSCLEVHYKGIAGLRNEDLQENSTLLPVQLSPSFLSPFLNRSRDKYHHAKFFLTNKSNVSPGHGDRIRKFIERLCDNLELSDRDKDQVLLAAEIHILAKYWHSEVGPANKIKAKTNIKLLRPIFGQPALVQMLRLMYCNLKNRMTQHPHLELLGSSALTAVDLLCETIDADGKLTRAGVEIVAQHLESLTGTLLLEDVVKALIELSRTDLPEPEDMETPCCVAIYSDSTNTTYALEARLRSEGLLAANAKSLESLVSIIEKHHPEIVILQFLNVSRDVVKSLHFLTAHGVNFNDVTTFLLVKSNVVDQLSPVLKLGIEDIVDAHGSLNALIRKIKKSMSHAEDSATVGSEESHLQTGSRGNLSDMNLIDLLQAMGPSRRTTKITVKADDESEATLIMYLSEGVIVFAQLGELVGEPAIHKALVWNSGTWNVEPTTTEDLPEHNVHESNESILMEGCRLLDESSEKVAAD